MKIIKYEHYDRDVFVQEHLKGKHKEHCLCYQNCIHFKPSDPYNCPTAEKVFRLCVDHGLTLPVWECPNYKT